MPLSGLSPAYHPFSFFSALMLLLFFIVPFEALALFITSVLNSRLFTVF